MFDSANDEDLSRGSMGSTATTWTASFWVYRTKDQGTDAKFMFTTSSDGGLSFADNTTANLLAWYDGDYNSKTARLFRDFNAWYHMVVKP